MRETPFLVRSLLNAKKELNLKFIYIYLWVSKQKSASEEKRCCVYNCKIGWGAHKVQSKA